MKYLVNLIVFSCVMVFGAQAQNFFLSGLGAGRFENGAYKPKDSVTYFYSNNNTGIPGWQWVEGIARSQNLRDSLYTIQPQLKYDSAWAWRGSSQGTYNKVLTYIQTLSGGKITQRGRYSSGNLTASETYNYNGQQLVERIVAGVKYTYQYTTNNQVDTVRIHVIKVTNGPWVQIGVVAYTYDMNNMLTQTFKDVEGEQTTMLYRYNVNNLLSRITTITGGTLANDTTEDVNYAYTSANDIETEYRMVRNDMTGDLQNYDIHNNTYDNNHNKLDDMWLVWNGGASKWDTFSKATYTYNAHKFVTGYESLRWDDASKTYGPAQDTAEYRSSLRLRLSYDYKWPVSVNMAETGQDDIQLYPVPAVEVLNILVKCSTARALDFTITDMQGRTLRHWSATKTKEHKQTIPITDLSTGIYTLNVNGMTKRFVVR